MKKMMTGFLVMALLANAGVAFAAESRRSQPTGAETIAAEFVRRLPIGTTVRVRMDDGTKVKGLLMGNEDGHAFIKVRTRIPEPPQKIDLSRVADADIVSGSNLAKGIAIGVAVGVGSVFAFGAMMAAMLGD